MFKRNKRRKTYRYYRRRRKKKAGLKAYLGSKLLEISIIVLAVWLLIYAFSFYKRLSQPEAKEGKNLILARIQILDGCQGCTKSMDKDVTQKVAEKLKRLKVNNIVYQIMEIGELKDSVFKESLILDRLGNPQKQTPSEVAFLTAEALGIREENVIYKRLKDNYQGIWLTIVIGEDWKTFWPRFEGV